MICRVAYVFIADAKRKSLIKIIIIIHSKNALSFKSLYFSIKKTQLLCLDQKFFRFPEDLLKFFIKFGMIFHQLFQF